MTQQVKILAAKTDDHSLPCGNHVAERADSSKSSLASTCMLWHDLPNPVKKKCKIYLLSVLS